MAVSDSHPAVGRPTPVGERREPLELAVGERLSGVVDPCAGHAVEPEPAVGDHLAVVVTADRRDVALAHRIDALAVPGVVADDVPCTHQPVDPGHIRQHRIQRDLVPVDIRDETEFHTCSLQPRKLMCWQHSTPMPRIAPDVAESAVSVRPGRTRHTDLPECFSGRPAISHPM